MVSGTENTLKALLITDIEAGILADCGAAVQTPNCISGLAAGIANAVIPHFVSNAQILPGSFNVPGFGAVVGIGAML